jgi:hypothetical protein
VKTTKSNINFDSIEFEISDKELESIKKSILQGCIKKVDQLSMHKWHYILKAEDKLIETEICYNKSNIKSFLCACGTKSPSKACKHVLLLSYWHATTILKNKEVSQINDYQIKSKLENSTNEDLKYYLNFLTKNNALNKQWIHFFLEARKNKTVTKSHFSNAIEHFMNFLNGATKNTASRIKYTLQLFEELYYISFYHYNRSNILNATSCLLAGISEIHKWHITIESKHQSRVVPINEKYHIALERITSNVIAPATLNKIYNSILTIINSKDYLILSPNSNLLSIYKVTSNKKQVEESLQNALKAKLKLDISEVYKYYILDYLYMKDSKYLSEFLSNFDQKAYPYWILTWLDKNKNKLEGEFLIETYDFLFNSASKALQDSIALKTMEVIKTQSISKYNKLLFKYYITTGNANLLQEYFARSEKDSILGDVIKELENYTSGHELNYYQKLDIALYSKQWALLVNLLGTTGYIEDLMKYDTYLPEDYHKQTILFYIKLLNEFLETHAGYKARQKLDTVFKHIKTVYPLKIQKIFQSQIDSQFPTRKYQFNQ